ncbi:hypothetical protein [Saccharopolyspora spinosa]|uniref:Uncharacterized protein n=2 Tax=Saccharopolyspora spinosa TaxID=60894 RepID=A0A2N3Y5P2_SACSN|nr:hypothetical protein [Saccharopolyspora spinosa]PKW18203.1 hypothetical protein A8926_6269 [Saccharopolyspora spinosa]
MNAQVQSQLHELLVRASAVLEDLADDVREQTVTDERYTETAVLMYEIAELLRDQSATYVPPRVIDGEGTGR